MNNMDLNSFRNKIETMPKGRSMSYVKQYNRFWAWKISIEQNGNNSILDTRYVNDTCHRLLEILPRWQTYRGIKCDYGRELPRAIRSISNAYNEIRQYSLLEFNQIPDNSLRLIWESLGIVKEGNKTKRPNLDYFVIAICKPLMFLWGQTLAFDSINRVNIRKDRSIVTTESPHRSSRWSYSQWKTIMQDFQLELLKGPNLIDYCQSHSRKNFGTDFAVPYGRYLDIYYYY